MPLGAQNSKAVAPSSARRLFVFNGGLLWNTRVRRILTLAGYSPTLGRPTADDLIGVWGQSPTAHRGEARALRTGANLVRIEDAWLRSLFPGRSGTSPPTGLLIDHQGVHFDPKVPSDLETLLATAPLDDTVLLERARGGIARLAEAHLTKYAAVQDDIDPPAPGYVLVLDQTKGDASVRASGADLNRFREMLYWAQEENPGARILIKTHPETAQGLRQGHFSESDVSERITFYDTPLSPWILLEGAIGVYTVSSQLGFEAIFAGHKPRVFGQPFYAGWGLTQDEFPVQRRRRQLTRAQLFAAAMIEYPTWYDPNLDRLCRYEDAAETLAAQARSWREDRHGYVASGMRLWKRKSLNQHFGRYKPLQFRDNLQDPSDRRPMIWASKATSRPLPSNTLRVEDGFLRSTGLGAALVPAQSLVLDDAGIYYDPRQPSRLEQLIETRRTLRPDQHARADRLIQQLRNLGLSKYNQGQDPPPLPKGDRILVPGQVEDDASIVTGAAQIRTNLALLQAVREANPNAVILYKPHPDVEAGLRPGHIEAGDLADMVLRHTDPDALLKQVDRVSTITSLLGFEALLRGVPVTTYGAPFYAGWGLSQDLAGVPTRRKPGILLQGLVHAALIDYPRYIDPITARPCPVETCVARLGAGTLPRLGPFNRSLSKLQGLLATYAYLWR
ncbi:MAG: capsular polysaccharide biosynthesis protein [Paracoccaceae bacterium]